MDNSDLVRSRRVRPRLATGYKMSSRGLKAVTDRENIPVGAGSAYSTAGDMARYAAALLNGGAGGSGRILRPESVALMFGPHYEPDPRIPGMGLGIFRGEAGNRKTIGHDGIWPGFHATMLLVPGQELGVLAFANTWPFGRPRRPGQLPTPSCANCSACPTMSPPQTFRNVPRRGASCAGGTPSARACSPTLSPGC